MKTVLSCGAGVETSFILLKAVKGEMERPDYAVFADTQFEPPEVYRHLEWLKEQAAKIGVAIDTVTAGNIEKDAIDFALRRGGGDVKRYASIPFYVDNNDGSQGMMPRQCTKEYKLIPIEQYHRRVVLGLEPKQHAPKEPAVEVWIGISEGENHRATPPGRWVKEEQVLGEDLLEDPVTVKRKVWKPVAWQVKAYPLLNVKMWPDRSTSDWDVLGGLWHRDDCVKWLKHAHPDRHIPKSACICCPYRSNSEWQHMRDTDAPTFGRAHQFGETIRQAYADGQHATSVLAGVPYIHRTMVPLAVVDFSERLPARKGCGALFDEEPDGMCGL